MSNARDKANIPALNFSSTGIDDNATSTAITITSGSDVQIGSTNSGVGGTIDLSIGNLSSSGGITLWSPTSSAHSIGFGDGFSGTDRYRGYLEYHHTGDSMRFGTSSTERMRLTSTGLGIGTSSPDAMLHIHDDGASTSTHSYTKLHIENDDHLALQFSGSTLGEQWIWFADDTTATPVGGITYYHGGQYMAFRAEGSERMRIDSSGNVGIGTTSPSEKLDVSGNINLTDSLLIDGAIKFEAVKSSSTGQDSIYKTATNTLAFNTGGTERMRIDSSGNLLVGKTASAYFIDGVTLHSGGGQFSNTDDFVMIVNRNGSDGNLVDFRQATVLEGSISVSGTTVSYNGFTGTHWSRFTDNSTPIILRGTVLETLDEMCDWYNLEFDVTTTTQDEDGNDVTNTVTEKVPHILTDTQSVGDTVTYNHEGTDVQATIVKETDVKHMKSKVSDTVDAKNVYGVFSAYDLDGEGYNDFYVASVGSFVVRIKANETIAKGDLLQSNGDGTAKVQTDDAVRSSSFAKVLSTTIIETYEDGSYLVPCSLNC
jgi:uncharacterized protein YaiE (UPF0345 family)